MNRPPPGPSPAAWDHGEVTWHEYGSRPVYSSPWVSVDLVDVGLPDGTRLDHHAVRLPGPAAGVVVVDETETYVLLIWRHRFITDTWGWEIPAGRVEAGEELAVGAAREVLEETGWRPGPLRALVDFYPTTGLSDQRFSIWVAAGAQHEGDPTDRNEAARVEWIPISELRGLVRRRQLTDGLSLTGVLAYLALPG
jgi:8-oxo-dGTP pyrophosphatase MutT (NUDIX family)